MFFMFNVNTAKLDSPAVQFNARRVINTVQFAPGAIGPTCHCSLSRHSLLQQRVNAPVIMDIPKEHNGASK